MCVSTLGGARPSSVVSCKRITVSSSSSGGQYRFDKIAIGHWEYDLCHQQVRLVLNGGSKTLKKPLRPIFFEVL